MGKRSEVDPTTPRESSFLTAFAGKPGCGKSVLAAMVTSDIAESSGTPASDGARVAYFFFTTSMPGMSSLTGAARALLAQLFDHDPENETLRKTLSYAMTNTQGQQIAYSRLITDLLKLAVRCHPCVHIVIDGLDECSAKDEEKEKFLYDLYDAISETNAKLIIFSRPSVLSLTRFATKKFVPSLDIAAELSSDDIRKYCRSRLGNLVTENMLPVSTSGNIDGLVENMAIGANGMFLWARLMFVYLRSPTIAPPHIAPYVRLRHIQTVYYPESLDQMYCRILNLIGDSDTYQRGVARQVFMWLIFGKSDCLEALGLHDILATSYHISLNGSAPSSILPREPLAASFSAFDETIVLACSSLVERWNSPYGTQYYRFIHSSAVDFFMSRFHSPTVRGSNGLQPFTREFFFMCPGESEMELTTSCVQYLLVYIPRKPLSGSISQSPDPGIVTNTYPFLRYASLFWSTHLRGAKIQCDHDSVRNRAICMLHELDRFLNDNLLMLCWIEAVYLFSKDRAMNNSIFCIEAWVRWGEQKQIHTGIEGIDELTDDMRQLVCDLRGLEDGWAKTLLLGPENIWGDVTAFCKSRFWKKTDAVDVESLAPKAPMGWLQSQKPLTTVSASDSKASSLATLSVWPSRQVALIA